MQVLKHFPAIFIIFKQAITGNHITVPAVKKYKDNTPVLVDDIVSTAHTMMETIRHLKRSGTKPAVCIAVHALFAGNAFEELKNGGAGEIISCNTVYHPSNKIDISALLVKSMEQE